MNKLINIVIFFPNGLNHQNIIQKSLNHIVKKSQIINKNKRINLIKRNIKIIIIKMKMQLNTNIQKKI